AHVVRAAAAADQAALPPVPAALPDRDRTVLVRHLRSDREREPLLREVDRPSGARAASVLLPDADALCVGSVRRVLRSRSGRTRGRRADATGDGAAGPLGPRHRRPRGPLCRYLSLCCGEDPAIL